MLPTGGHVIHLSDVDGSVSTHTVAMFHQLRCLDILQTAYVEEGRHLTDPMVPSCMNYLRQTLLCQMDIRNEPQGSVLTENGFDTLCYNWEGIFEQAEKNHAAFASRL